MMRTGRNLLFGACLLLGPVGARGQESGTLPPDETG
jgi:hypothetical protein